MTKNCFKILLLVFSLMAIGNIETKANQNVSNPTLYQRIKKDGTYRKKSHWFKKLIQGKKYCNCP